MKRSTPLQRTAALRSKSTLSRKTRLSPRSKTNSHALRPRGKSFMAWVSRQPCMVQFALARLHYAALGTLVAPDGLLPECAHCAGRIHVDHAGNRFTQGNGTRAHDRTCIPLCEKHHVQRTNWAGTPGQAGVFYGFSLEALRRWCDEAIRINQARAKAYGIEVPTC